MPRKAKTADTVAQNRDSQRRSRARQKDIVEDLRRQLHEYEQRGVDASLAMQRAAQQVEHENRRLRLLLARHGVTQRDVDAFVRLPDDAIECAPANARLTEPRRQAQLTPPTQSPSTPPLDIWDAASGRYVEALPSYGAQRCLPSSGVYHDSQPYPRPGRWYETTWRDANAYSQPPGQLDQRPVWQPETQAPQEYSTSPLGTSCIAAANIIAELRGQSSAAEALMALGCSTRDCMVKNTDVLSVMDRVV